MDNFNDILEKVVRIQNTQDYTDSEMAQKIGCSRPLYQRTRTGKVPVGGTFLRGAMQLIESDIRPAYGFAGSGDVRNEYQP